MTADLCSTAAAVGVGSASIAPAQEKRLLAKVNFYHFVDQTEQFVVFWEKVAERRWVVSVDD